MISMTRNLGSISKTLIEVDMVGIQLINYYSVYHMTGLSIIFCHYVVLMFVYWTICTFSTSKF